MSAPLLDGRYRLLEVIGHGGMGQVWRAADEVLGRTVAVKTLELAGADESAAERFRREARTTAGLAHPNIVTVFDFGVDDKTAYLVMELLTGPTLASTLTDRTRLPVAEVLVIADQVALALVAAHAAGVVHRDIKPGNIAVAGDGTVKVLDFGVARLLEATTHQAPLTQASTVLGTAAYLSPEQAGGGEVDARTDLYAFGCLLFTLLSGGPPFTGDSPLAICAQHLHAAPPRLAAVAPEVPMSLAGLVDDLLAKNPADRPASAEVVRARLANVDVASAGLPPTARLIRDERSAATVTRQLATRTQALTRPWAPLIEPVRRRPATALLAAVVAATLVGLIVALASGGGTPHRVSTSSTTPVHSPAPSSPPTSSSPAVTSAATAIEALQSAIGQASAAGGLTAPAAQDLLNRLNSLSMTLASGHNSDAGHMVTDLVHQLSNLLQSGQLTSAGQAMLATPLATLEQFIPPGGDGGPPPGGD